MTTHEWKNNCEKYVAAVLKVAGQLNDAIDEESRRQNRQLETGERLTCLAYELLRCPGLKFRVEEDGHDQSD